MYCSSSSGNKVDLLSGTNMYTTLVVSDWCITNLAQGWWVSIQSIVGIFRGWWFPRKPMKILLPLHYSLTQLLSRSTNRIISKKMDRNREGEPCMDKLIATKEMNHAMIMKIHLSQFGSCCQHTRKNLALRQLCGCFINKIGQFSVGFCNQQSFWGPLPDSVRNLTKRVFKSTSLQEKKLHFKSWFGQHWSQGCKQSQKVIMTWWKSLKLQVIEWSHKNNGIIVGKIFVSIFFLLWRNALLTI